MGVSLTIQIPMPNETFEGGIVVASCWLNDDPMPGQPASAALLLLTPTHGSFYKVVEVERRDQKWNVTVATDFPNIIPATEDYSDLIGGY